MLISLTYRQCFLSLVLATVILCSNLLSAGADVASTNASQVQQAKQSQDVNGTDFGLSTDSINVAKSLGILPQLQQLQALKNNTGANADENLTKLKVDLLQAVLIASYETRSVVNKIEREIAQSGEVNTYLSEQRDRALRINTYVNFISGGITRIVTGGLTLGSVNHIAPDTLVTIEGVIQTSLASWGVWQMRGEKRLERSGKENMLAPIFDPSSRNAVYYPRSVWTYLNTVPSSGSAQQSRRLQLVDHWYSHGLYLMSNKHKMSDIERVQKTSGTHEISFKLTPDILRDRMTMLTDLKTVVNGMDDNVLEIFQFIKRESK